MSIILVNEAAGDILIDTAIPAVYSAVFVVGYFLLSMSVLALLLSLLLIVAAATYWALVYRSASAAHTRRKEKLKGMQCAGHWSGVSRLRYTASSGATSDYFTRVFSIMRHSLQHGITLLSVRHSRRAKKSLSQERAWCDMNKLVAYSLREEGSLEDPMKRNPSSHYSHFLIADGTLKTAMTMKSYTVASLQQPTLQLNSGPAIVTASNKEDSMRRLTPLIVFESREMMTLIRSRLFSQQECDTASIQCLEVIESDLDREFRRALDVFYPDGIALSPTEKEEACELYDQWRTSVNDHFVLKIVESSTVLIRIIRLSIFEEWLSNGILGNLKSNLTDRLMDNALRHVPNFKKRLAETRSTSSVDCCEFKSKENLKSLNVITPQHIAMLANSATVSI